MNPTDIKSDGTVDVYIAPGIKASIDAKTIWNTTSGPPFRQIDYELEGPNFRDEKGQTGVLHALLTQVVKDGGMAYGKIMVIYPKDKK